MKTRCLTALALATLAGTVALAQPAKDKPATPAKPAASQPATPAKPAHPDKPITPGKDMGHHPADMQLPPGMTAEDMAACMAAGTPGPQHKHLAEQAGTWHGKTKMWMTSGMKDPVESECSTVITPMMDGRFVRIETSGDMGEMGPFNGFGITGYDNVGQEFQSTWIDNCGTGMMVGSGELSSDGKTMTWTFTANCPITKKPTSFRQVERRTGNDTMVMEMFGKDPKAGNKEFKMLEIHYTRTGGTAAVPTKN